MKILFQKFYFGNVISEAAHDTSKNKCLWNCFYADDFVLIAETVDLLLEKLRIKKKGIEMKGFRVNAGKTKVMWCQVSKGQIEDSGEHPNSVCRKGVGCKSIMCIECLRWVYKGCSGISGKLE